MSAAVDPSDVLAVLRAAETWLSVPEHWTTGTFSRDAHGGWLGIDGCRTGAAASTCGVGAIYLVCGGFDDRVSAARKALSDALGAAVSHVNDNYHDGYERIMAGYRHAIEALEARL